MPQQTLSGSWTAELSGGCPKNATWPSNPQYLIKPTRAGSFSIDLTQFPAAGATLVPIGIAVLHARVGEPLRTPILAKHVVGKSKYKSVRTQSLRVELQPAPSGQLLVLVPMTFEPGQQSAFQLTATSDEAGTFTIEPYAAPTQPAPTRPPLAVTNGPAAPPPAAPPPTAPSPAAPPPTTLSPAVPPAPSAGLSAGADAAATSDATLRAAVDAYRAQTGGSGPFEDGEFALRSSGKIDNTLFYLAGQARRRSVGIPQPPAARTAPLPLALLTRRFTPALTARARREEGGQPVASESDGWQGRHAQLLAARVADGAQGVTDGRLAARRVGDGRHAARAAEGGVPALRAAGRAARASLL